MNQQRKDGPLGFVCLWLLCGHAWHRSEHKCTKSSTLSTITRVPKECQRPLGERDLLENWPQKFFAWQQKHTATKNCPHWQVPMWAIFVALFVIDVLLGSHWTMSFSWFACALWSFFLIVPFVIHHWCMSQSVLHSQVRNNAVLLCFIHRSQMDPAIVKKNSCMACLRASKSAVQIVPDYAPLCCKSVRGHNDEQSPQQQKVIPSSLTERKVELIRHKMGAAIFTQWSSPMHLGNARACKACKSRALWLQIALTCSPTVLQCPESWQHLLTMFWAVQTHNGMTNAKNLLRHFQGTHNPLNCQKCWCGASFQHVFSSWYVFLLFDGPQLLEMLKLFCCSQQRHWQISPSLIPWFSTSCPIVISFSTWKICKSITVTSKQQNGRQSGQIWIDKLTWHHCVIVTNDEICFAIETARRKTSAMTVDNLKVCTPSFSIQTTLLPIRIVSVGCSLHLWCCKAQHRQSLEHLNSQSTMSVMMREKSKRISDDVFSCWSGERSVAATFPDSA